MFADFAKAFDLIDHNLLLRKSALYKLSPKTLTFICSFLSDRKQSVCIENRYSRQISLKYGVPQGSILGPLLFSLYINDLPLFIKTLIALFADDTTTYSSSNNLKTLTSNLQDILDKLLNWTDLNHMVLSSEKTKYMLITTRQKRQNISSNPPSVYIKDKKLEEVDKHKVLGLIIDNNLSWSCHLSTLSKNISQKVFQLSRIKHFLDIDSRKIFFEAHIKSLIDFSSTIWDGASDNSMKFLHRVYKRAIKTILLKSTSLSANDYHKLDLLPLKQLLYFNKTVLMHKIVFENAPSYLINLFSTNEYRHEQKLVFPRPRIDLFKNSLQYSGGTQWNNLPKHLKQITSPTGFKTNLKKYLMDKIVC